MLVIELFASCGCICELKTITLLKFIISYNDLKMVIIFTNFPIHNYIKQ